MSKIQSGGVDILNLKNTAEVVDKIANKAKDLSNKKSLHDVIKIADIPRKFLPHVKNVLPDPIKKFRTGITLTKNEKKRYYKSN